MLKYFKKDRWFPTIYNRFDYDNWAKQKDKTLLEKSQKKMKDILDKETKVYLSKEQEKDLGKIIKEYLKELWYSHMKLERLDKINMESIKTIEKKDHIDYRDISKNEILNNKYKY